MTIEEVLAVEEMQIFDRKSVHIDPKALAIPVIAFANADGDTVAIGIPEICPAGNYCKCGYESPLQHLWNRYSDKNV
ncbi:MAG: hypothetical protein ACLTBR_00775 [Anaerostipes sp.]|uniref:hypothetical protein n=1 Tax=Anaerostipes sp. TaxID=1872530 RepID=UPI003992EC4F